MTSNPRRPAAALAGIAPVAAVVDDLDWSGSPAEAAVGRLLEAVHAWDRLAVQVVEALVRVVESGATDEALGVAVELVLSQSARMVRFERTTLLRVATTLAAMPATRAAFRDEWISFSHVKAIVTAVRRVPIADRDEVDALVGQVAHDYRDHEADALVHDVDWLVDNLLASRRASRPIETNRTCLSPRLDGSGTSFTDWDADHFPLFVQAIDNAADQRHPLHAEPGADGLSGGSSDDDGMVTDSHRHAWRMRGRTATRRAKALFELVTGCDHDTLGPLDHDGIRPSGRPAVAITCTVQALLDGTAPAWVLNRLGGRISVTSATARRWLDTAGADTNVFLFDDCGEVVGHGRRQRHARGWLRDAIIARDLHDTAPCSTTPAAFCDVDHVTDWEAGGPTDAPNLGLLSRRWHTLKTSGHWQLTRHPDGTRTWTQTRSGYTISQPRPPHLTPGTHPPSTDDPGQDHGPSP